MPAISFKDKQIYYEVHGTGKPLFILNGIMMSTASWVIFLPYLAAHHQVVLLDFLDQGQSSKMAGETYKQDLQVEVVKAVMDNLGFNRINLLGISYGGEVALQFAIKYTAIVDKLLLFNTCAATSPWLHDIGIGWKIAAARHDAELFYHVSIPVIYSPSFYTQNAQWMADRKKLLLSVFDENFLGSVTRLIDSAEGYDVVASLPNITADTLVVGSDFDFITPLPDQLAIQQAIRGAKFVEIKNSGHASMYEQPQMFLTLVNGFLSAEQLSLVN